MLPQDVVRIRFSSFSVFNQSTWQSCGILLTFALAATTGCRSPFGRSNPEPSFDRLLELENSSVSMSTPARSTNNFAQQQIAQRRPGGNTVSSRFVEQEGNVELNPPAGIAAKRRISDLDEEVLENVDVETKLLRQTQLALENSAENAPDPTAEDFDSTKPKTAPRKNNSKRNTDDELVMRMTDKSDRDQTDVEAEEPTTLEKLASNRKSKSAADEATSPKNWVAAVQPVTHSSNGPERAVKPAFNSYDETEVAEEKLTWEQHVRQAVQQIDKSSNQELAGPQERVRQALISRLLALSLNDREEMLNPIEGLQPHEQDYVNHQLSAIFDAIDPDANPVSSRKWSLVMLNQRKANTHLASLSNLEINNVAFCTEVIDFGVTTPFQVNKFSPDQEVLLYLELDNFVSEKSKDGKGYETQLQGSYEIVDSSGRRVADQMLPADSHICKNIRRDYFIAYRVYMPSKISAGNYKLKLTIEDLKGRKFGQADIQFQIQQ